MKTKKITLAALLAIGVLAGANTAFSQESSVSGNLSNEILAACPLSGCGKADNNCVKHKKADCKACTPAAADCRECPPLAQCPAPSAPACASCAGLNDGRKFEQQVYAYPAAIYGHNQVVGERNNGIYLGDGAKNAFSGVPIAEIPSAKTACGCEDGSMTGAAAAMPCLDNIPNAFAVPVDRNPANLDGAGCPVQIHTKTSMNAVRHTMEPFMYTENSGLTGGAAPFMSYYPDVPEGYWAGCDINTLTANSVLEGYPDRTFKPNIPVTRAEMAAMSVKGLNLSGTCTSGSALFKDVPSNHWAARHIAQAVENGLMAGYPDNTFKPNQSLSRAEAFAIIAKGINTPMDECQADNVLSRYNDAASVPSWAKISAAKVLEAGGLTDFPHQRNIQPGRDASRAEIASIIENVRISLGYSTEKTADNDCACTPKQAYFQNEEIVQIPTLQLTFSDEISAKSAHIGDRFMAKTIDEVTIDGQRFPAGSSVYGTVSEVVRPDKKCSGAIKLSFNEIKNGKCKAKLPNQILTAQVNKVKKPNGIARLVEFPFTWTGGLLGTAARTVGGAIVSAGNAVEQTISGIGVGTGEIFQGEFKAAGRSYGDVIKAAVTAPVDLTRTALSGTMGLFQYSGDEISYLVDPNGMRVSSVNPKEKVTIAFGCNSQ